MIENNDVSTEPGGRGNPTNKAPGGSHAQAQVDAVSQPEVPATGHL
jgi:hypothetical protein